MNLSNGTSLNKAMDHSKEVLWPTLLANWKLWPAAMLVNFAIIPPHFSVLYVNIVAIAWNAYLSMVFNQKKL